MRILLDTHVYLWCLKDDRRKLSKAAHTLIMDADEVYVSSVSIWEAVIKCNIGKLHVNVNQLVDAIAESGFEELAFTATHAAAVNQLPLIHQDPFDRALIAQAVSEPLWLITVDKKLQKYSDLVKII